MKTDIEIAQQVHLHPIHQIAERLQIPSRCIEPYGHYKAKIALEEVQDIESRPKGKLVLVSAMSPTPAGEGKTTTTVGLGDALNRIGKRAVICLREPSLGPVFGMKGGAAGGGYAQIVPMEDINLHFTGDFNAVALAHNLLSALIDNHIHQGNELGFDVRRITWKRVMDMNDRALRDITVGLGGVANGFPRQDGFDIVVASELMAILCLSRDLGDLKERIGNIVVGYTEKQEPIVARQLKAHGAMTALLKEAIKPNLVQTLEHSPAIVHGGPFANIAHGCNSVIATQTALRLGEYVVTEAGFGADLGAEKFINIKCRKSGLRPHCAVIVATIKALKYHGGVEKTSLGKENFEALKKGLANLERHWSNLEKHFGLPCVIALNHFSSDTAEEIKMVKEHFPQVPVVVAYHWSKGSEGAEELAREVVRLSESVPSQLHFTYHEQQTIREKIEAVATQVYRAKDIAIQASVEAKIKRLQEAGYGHYPVCIAKTQYSFSSDAALRGAPVEHVLHIRDVRLQAGAEFIVVICGDIMTMPGLPKVPAAQQIDIDKEGRITGLF